MKIAFCFWKHQASVIAFWTRSETAFFLQLETNCHFAESEIDDADLESETNEQLV